MSRFLEHYARELGACEVNATFYRLEEPRAVERWAKAVPEEFRFAAKAHRRLTQRNNASILTQSVLAITVFVAGMLPLVWGYSRTHNFSMS